MKFISSWSVGMGFAAISLVNGREVPNTFNLRDTTGVDLNTTSLNNVGGDTAKWTSWLPSYDPTDKHYAPWANTPKYHTWVPESFFSSGFAQKLWWRSDYQSQTIEPSATPSPIVTNSSPQLEGRDVTETFPSQTRVMGSDYTVAQNPSQTEGLLHGSTIYGAYPSYTHAVFPGPTPTTVDQFPSVTWVDGKPVSTLPPDLTPTFPPSALTATTTQVTATSSSSVTLTPTPTATPTPAPTATPLPTPPFKDQGEKDAKKGFDEAMAQIMGVLATTIIPSMVAYYASTLPSSTPRERKKRDAFVLGGRLVGDFLQLLALGREAGQATAAIFVLLGRVSFPGGKAISTVLGAFGLANTANIVAQLAMRHRDARINIPVAYLTKASTTLMMAFFAKMVSRIRKNPEEFRNFCRIAMGDADIELLALINKRPDWDKSLAEWVNGVARYVNWSGLVIPAPTKRYLDPARDPVPDPTKPDTFAFVHTNFTDADLQNALGPTLGPAFQGWMAQHGYDPKYAHQWDLKPESETNRYVGNVRPYYAPAENPNPALSYGLWQAIGKHFVSQRPAPIADPNAVLRGEAPLAEGQEEEFFKRLLMQYSQNALMNEELGRLDFDLDALDDLKTEIARVKALSIPEQNKPGAWDEVDRLIAVVIKDDQDILYSQYAWAGLNYPLGNVPGTVFAPIPPTAIYLLAQKHGGVVPIGTMWTLFVAQFIAAGFVIGDSNKACHIRQSAATDHRRGDMPNHKTSLSDVPGLDELEILFREGIGKLFQAMEEDANRPSSNAQPVSVEQLEAFLDVGNKITKKFQQDLQAFRDNNPPQGWGAPATLKEAEDRYREALKKLQKVREQVEQYRHYMDLNFVGQEWQNIARHTFRNFGVFAFQMYGLIQGDPKVGYIGSMASLAVLYFVQASAGIPDERKRWKLGLRWSFVHADLEGDTPEEVVWKVKGQLMRGTEQRVKGMRLDIERLIRLKQEEACVELGWTGFRIPFTNARSPQYVPSHKFLLPNYGVHRTRFEQYERLFAKRIGKPSDWEDPTLLQLRNRTPEEKAAPDFNWAAWKRLEEFAHEPLDDAAATRLRDLESRAKNNTLTDGPLGLWRKQEDALDGATPAAERATWEARAARSLTKAEFQELAILRIRKACTPADSDFNRLENLLVRAGFAADSSDGKKLTIDDYVTAVRLKYWGQDNTLRDESGAKAVASADTRNQADARLDNILAQVEDSGNLTPDEIAECHKLGQKCFIGLTQEEQVQLDKALEDINARGAEPMVTRVPTSDGSQGILINRQVVPAVPENVERVLGEIAVLRDDLMKLQYEWFSLSKPVLERAEQAIRTGAWNNFMTDNRVWLSKLGDYLEFWMQIHQGRAEGWQLGLAGTATLFLVAATFNLLRSYHVKFSPLIRGGAFMLTAALATFGIETNVNMNQLKDKRRYEGQKDLAEGKALGHGLTFTWRELSTPLNFIKYPTSVTVDKFNFVRLALEFCTNAINAPFQMRKTLNQYHLSNALERKFTGRDETPKEYIDSRHSTNWRKRWAGVWQTVVAGAAIMVAASAYRAWQSRELHALPDGTGLDLDYTSPNVNSAGQAAVFVAIASLIAAVGVRVVMPSLQGLGRSSLETTDADRAFPLSGDEEEEAEKDILHRQMVRKQAGLSASGFTANTIIATTLAIGMTMIPIAGSTIPGVNEWLPKSPIVNADVVATGIRAGAGAAGFAILTAWRLLATIDNGLPLYEVSDNWVVGSLAESLGITSRKDLLTRDTLARVVQNLSATALTALTTLGVGKLTDLALGDEKTMAMAALQIALMAKVAMHVYADLTARNGVANDQHAFQQTLQATGSMLSNAASGLALDLFLGFESSNPKSLSELTVGGNPDTSKFAGKAGWGVKNIVFDRIEGVEQATLRLLPSLPSHLILDFFKLIVPTALQTSGASITAERVDEFHTGMTFDSDGNLPSHLGSNFPTTLADDGGVREVSRFNQLTAGGELDFDDTGEISIVRRAPKPSGEDPVAYTQFVEGVKAAFPKNIEFAVTEVTAPVLDSEQYRITRILQPYFVTPANKKEERYFLVSSHNKDTGEWLTKKVSLLPGQDREFDGLLANATPGNQEGIDACNSYRKELEASAVEEWMHANWSKTMGATLPPERPWNKGTWIPGSNDLQIVVDKERGVALPVSEKPPIASKPSISPTPISWQTSSGLVSTASAKDSSEDTSLPSENQADALGSVFSELERIEQRINGIIAEEKNTRQLGAVSLGKDLQQGDNGDLKGSIIFGHDDKSKDSRFVVIWKDSTLGTQKRKQEFVVLERSQLQKVDFTTLSGETPQIQTTIDISPNTSIEPLIAQYMAKNKESIFQNMALGSNHSSKPVTLNVQTSGHPVELKLRTNLQTFLTRKGRTLTVPVFEILGGTPPIELANLVSVSNKSLLALCSQEKASLHLSRREVKEAANEITTLMDLENKRRSAEVLSEKHKTKRTIKT